MQARSLTVERLRRLTREHKRITIFDLLPVETLGQSAMERSSKKTALTAVAANVAIAVTKFAAAWYTGSSAMLSEGIHSLVDSSNGLLLFYGLHRAARPADEEHPFGHGRELYFWSFIVALLIFSLGAGLSFYEGVTHIANPAPITTPLISIGVLFVAAAFEGYSWSVAYRQVATNRGEASLLQTIRRSKNPAGFIVLLEDSAALAGLGVALAGISASALLDMPVLDGAASIGVALVLASTAAFLAYEVKSLLIGEPARASVRKGIRDLALKQHAITDVCDLFTVHLGPNQVLALMTARFDPKLSASTIADAVEDFKKASKAAFPDLVTVYVTPQRSGDPAKV
jgi:cation diffusion facilitator family transporter